MGLSTAIKKEYIAALKQRINRVNLDQIVINPKLKDSFGCCHTSRNYMYKHIINKTETSGRAHY